MIKRLLIIPVLVVLIFMLIGIQGCKENESSPTAPPAAGANNTFSFTTEQGSFSATGPLNLYATSGSGVGFYDDNTITAYSIGTPPTGSIAGLTILDTLAVRSYSFSYLQAVMSWSLNVNLLDTSTIAAAACIAKSGSVTITSLSAEKIQGTFSGTYTARADTSVTYNLTNGTFDIER